MEEKWGMSTAGGMCRTIAGGNAPAGQTIGAVGSERLLPGWLRAQHVFQQVTHHVIASRISDKHVA